MAFAEAFLCDFRFWNGVSLKKTIGIETNVLNADGIIY